MEAGASGGTEERSATCKATIGPDSVSWSGIWCVEAAARCQWTRSGRSKVRRPAIGFEGRCTPVDWLVGQAAGSRFFDGLGIEGKDLEVEFFVDDFPFLLRGGHQQIIGHVHQQAQIAGGVFAESLDQR